MLRPCDHCTRPYEAKVAELNRGQGRYCSRRCSGNARSARRVPPEPNEVCAHCSTPFYRPQSKRRSELAFCCREHADVSGLLQRGPAPTRPSCACGQPIDPRSPVTACRRCRTFTILCQWLEGDLSVATGANGEAKRFVKATLVEMRGDCCEVCGFAERHSDGQSIIQMDHIDGDPTNHLIDNLRLLCPNHHALTENYGMRNAGKGRDNRRQRRAARSAELAAA